MNSILKNQPDEKAASSRRIHTEVAKALFCSPEFAMIDFKQMNIEDWRVHASRAWEVADVFVNEIKRHPRKRKPKQPV